MSSPNDIRDWPSYCAVVRRLWAPARHTATRQMNLQWAALGVLAELGEVAGLLKRPLEGKGGFDPALLAEEVGDVGFYVASASIAMGNDDPDGGIAPAIVSAGNLAFGDRDVGVFLLASEAHRLYYRTIGLGVDSVGAPVRGLAFNYSRLCATFGLDPLAVARENVAKLSARHAERVA